LKKEHSEEENK